MGDLTYLNSLVVNTTYLDAQQTAKRRSSISLPIPSSSGLLDSEGSCYESLCEQQPIGRKLFHQFLFDSNSQYAAAAKLWEELDSWQYIEDEAKEKARLSILAKICQSESRTFLLSLTGDTAEKYTRLSSGTFNEEVMDHMREATRKLIYYSFTALQKCSVQKMFTKYFNWCCFTHAIISKNYCFQSRAFDMTLYKTVCAVQAKHTGQIYACKKLDKRRLKKKGGERLALIEKQILEKANSRFVINLAYAYDDKMHLCLVMDLMNGGDLKFHIYDLGKRGIRMERVVYYVAQITIGILHLHGMNIVYRDMKPENVLLDAKGQCRLSDFGLAVELTKGKKICQKAGTTGYMAPEILKQENYSMSVDWWSVGCSIYEMVAARLPFKDFKEKVQNEEVTRRTLEDECKFEHRNFDGPIKDLISRFLKKRVQNRLGCRSGDDPRNH
uniref:G protein-coupled receptor kinase 7b n=1 Tax=Tetraodon nigroviridis TaxID=99883 RepID=H3DRG7_TETNG